MVWLGLAALAAPPHAAVDLMSRSEHLQLLGSGAWPVGVDIPLAVRNRHDDRTLKLALTCGALAVRSSDGQWLSGEGASGGLRKLGPAKEGTACVWTGRWADGEPVGPGSFGVALSGRIDGNAVVDGGGTVAWRIERVEPEPIDPAVEVRIAVKRGFAATSDDPLAERVAAGWRVALVDVFPDGDDVVTLRVTPK
jgi:hypothetical protein